MSTDVTHTEPSHQKLNIINHSIMPPLGPKSPDHHTKAENPNLFASAGSLPRVHLRNASTLAQPNVNSEPAFVPRSPQHLRGAMKLVESGAIEEAMYNNNYQQTLNQEKGYHRQKGYFTDFARRNKILNDQYIEKREPTNDHTRYISKPVFFTTLQSKNQMSATIATDHSQLMQMTRNNSGGTSGFMTNTNFGLKKLTTNRSFSSSKIKFGGSPTHENNKAQETKKDDDSPFYGSPKSSTTYSKFNKTLDKLAIKESLSSPTKHTSPRTNMIASFARSEQSENPLKAHAKSYKPKPRGFQKSPDIHELGKYHTKEMADALALDYGSRTQVDPEVYIQHRQDVEYMRDTAIVVAVMDKEKKFQRAHQGSPQPYKRNPKLAAYEEPNPYGEIDKFDETIRGWIQSVPNFGKQRWTYDKAWEYKIV